MAKNLSLIFNSEDDLNVEIRNGMIRVHVPDRIGRGVDIDLWFTPKLASEFPLSVRSRGQYMMRRAKARQRKSRANVKMEPNPFPNEDLGDI